MENIWGAREMKSKLAALLAVTLISLMFFYAVTPCFAVDGVVSYQLVNQDDGTFTHTLNVVIPQSLTEYYNGLSHRSASVADFPKFVTPYALKPIADCLRQIYPDDEDFTNGVLVLIHQIPYEEVLQAYYPAETLLRNSGDCDLMSLVAASILMAGGLDVVLLHYESEAHMNIGVHLAQKPNDARLPVYSLQNNGVTYYVAESTSTNWQEGWRVGECPEDLKTAPAQIVTLEGHEGVAPGQVSASFTKLDPTTLRLEVSPTITIEGNLLTIHGQVTPAVPNERVTVYWSPNGEPWAVLTTAVTQANGQFEYTWKPPTSGFIDMLDVRASWTGNQQYAGTTSQTKNSTILSFLMLIGIVASIVVIVVSVVAVATRRRKTKPPEAAAPTNEIPPPEQPTQ